MQLMRGTTNADNLFLGEFIPAYVSRMENTEIINS